MAKKCIPGVICIENMTLLILLIVLGVVAYLIYTQKHVRHLPEQSSSPKILVVPSTPPTLAGIATRSNDSLNDPYAPPLKDNGYYMQRNSSDVRGVPGIPINVETRGTGMSYQQVGILTPSGGNRSGDNALILPLMGRRTMTGRDKWQYYTMANGVGSLNTKLPVSVNGKSCTNEYGCDDIQNGSTVYVEGYNEVFIATIYENNTFAYIPYL